MAELALAVLPLCLSALKGLKLAEKSFKRLRKLRRFRDEISSRKTQFITEKELFLDECQLLLQHFLDRDTAEALIRDENHPRWRCPKLHEEIKTLLGRKYESFSQETRNIKETIYAIDRILGEYEESNGGLVKLKAPEKVHQSFAVAFDTAKYSNKLTDLKKSNKLLHRMLDNVFKFEQKQVISGTKRPRPIPERYSVISGHSKSFYEALATCWSCLQSQHFEHEMKLFLEPETDDSLHVVMRYTTATNRHDFCESLDILVQSQSLRTFRLDTTGTIAAECQQSATERLSKARRLQCDSGATTAEKPSTGMLETNKSQDVEIPVAARSENLCSQLCQTKEQGSTTTPGCSTYLDTCDLRHMFYPLSRSRKDAQKLSKLSDVLFIPKDEKLTPQTRVSIALQLANGVLQYHSTPWLSPLWHLRDLGYFRDDEDDLDISLRTLHISSDVVSKRLDAYVPEQDMKMHASGYEAIHKAQQSSGIRNLTLYSLGVAMLQIGLWKDVDSGDVVEVRDLMDHNVPLGPRYQRIAKKCLWCDFGLGSANLADPDLQSAIYRDVVCELQSIKNSLQ